MPEMTWHKDLAQYSEGVEKVALFLDKESYATWSGVRTIDDSTSFTDRDPYHLDGKTMGFFVKTPLFSGKIEAFVYPEVLDELIGFVSDEYGVVNRQDRAGIATLVYTTNFRNEDGPAYSQIHVIYNVSFAPGVRSNTSIGDSPAADMFVFDLATQHGDPVAPGESTHFIYDESKMNPVHFLMLSRSIYGTDTSSPKLASKDELRSAFSQFDLLTEGIDSYAYGGVRPNGSIYTVPNSIEDPTVSDIDPSTNKWARAVAYHGEQQVDTPGTVILRQNPELGYNTPYPVLSLELPFVHPALMVQCEFEGEDLNGYTDTHSRRIAYNHPGTGKQIRSPAIPLDGSPHLATLVIPSDDNSATPRSRIIFYGDNSERSQEVKIRKFVACPVEHFDGYFDGDTEDDDVWRYRWVSDTNKIHALKQRVEGFGDIPDRPTVYVSNGVVIYYDGSFWSTLGSLPSV